LRVVGKLKIILIKFFFFVSFNILEESFNGGLVQLSGLIAKELFHLPGVLALIIVFGESSD